jgi:hypothetical protein
LPPSAASNRRLCCNQSLAVDSLKVGDEQGGSVLKIIHNFFAMRLSGIDAE